MADKTVAQRIIDGLRRFSEQLERGDPIAVTSVRRVETPDGPMHVTTQGILNAVAKAETLDRPHDCAVIMRPIWEALLASRELAPATTGWFPTLAGLPVHVAETESSAKFIAWTLQQEGKRPLLVLEES